MFEASLEGKARGAPLENFGLKKQNRWKTSNWFKMNSKNINGKFYIFIFAFIWMLTTLNILRKAKYQLKNSNFPMPDNILS